MQMSSKVNFFSSFSGFIGLSQVYVGKGRAYLGPENSPGVVAPCRRAVRTTSRETFDGYFGDLLLLITAAVWMPRFFN